MCAGVYVAKLKAKGLQASYIRRRKRIMKRNSPRPRLRLIAFFLTFRRLRLLTSLTQENARRAVKETRFSCLISKCARSYEARTRGNAQKSRLIPFLSRIF